jgi:hypothetical protein
MELPEKNKTQKQLSHTSLPTMALLKSGNFEAVERSVGMRVADILDRTPICVLKQEAPQERLELFIATQLTKLLAGVNISRELNIQTYQIPIIAAQLVELYPVETLEDFVLCFKRGQVGFYGTIYKLDASVICGWMEKYLDEKYQLRENEAARQKKETDEGHAIDYDKFKERVGEFIKQKRQTNANENAYQRFKLENNYRYFTVRNLQIYATSQAHAEGLVQRMIDTGELEEF